MHLSIDDLLEKYNTIQDKVNADIKKEFDSKPVLWLWNDNFHNEEIPKEDSNHTCLVIISLDFALKKMKTIIDKCF